MKESNFIAFGSLDYLRSKFAQGKYEVKIKICIPKRVIDNLIYENDYKNNLKVTLKNYKEILKHLGYEKLEETYLGFDRSKIDPILSELF